MHFIALYRGINVGGKNSVKMEALRAMHEWLGHRDVKSYLQSGNVVFSASGSSATVARVLAERFVGQFGFAAPVVLVDANRWNTILKANPYADVAAGHPKTVHAGICQGKPDAKALAALLSKTGGSESFVVKEDVIYLHTPDGFGKSKFAAGIEKAAGLPITMRNWRTMEALAALAEAIA